MPWLHAASREGKYGCGVKFSGWSSCDGAPEGGLEIFAIFLFFFFFVATHPSCTRRWGATYCQQEASWHLPRHFLLLHKHSIITLCLILLLLKVSEPFYSKSAFSTLTIAFFCFFYCVRAVRRQTARHTQEGIHPRPASFCHSLPFYSPFRQHEKQLNQHHFLSAAILLCSPPKKINPPPTSSWIPRTAQRLHLSCRPRMQRTPE